MFYTSKGLSFILALGISVASVFFLYLFARPGASLLMFQGFITFFISFVLTLYLLDSLIFREIRNAGRRMEGVDESASAFGEHPSHSNNLKEMLTAMATASGEKQKEIERLRKQEAFRKDLIADISHELKTPIFAAQGFVHTLLDGAVKEKGVRKRFLKKAAKSLDGLDILVQDLLTLSQIETGQVTMHLEDVDLVALTEEVFDQLKKQSDKKELSLRLKGPVRKVMVHADGHRIFHVLLNLISNAVKHSFPGGKIEVSFVVKKQSVVTRVTDHGEGIAQEHIHRIFERFYRVDKSRSREKGGTGLGLAIVKHILEGHNSKPKVESIPGEGSTFSFKLPRVLNEEAANGTQDTEQTSKETEHLIP
jgi:two-component system, OmpR family, phosphate regulon sensor histidine kinase PhoR